ncbi:flavodoxin [Chryseobacterium capnotolerans]|nr:flavodoxin [Chryseobacterium capnotolerans]
MKSFLSQNNFKGKTIVPFNTNAGYGIGNSFDTVKKLSPDSRILEGFTIKGGVERDGILFVMEGKKKIEAEKKVKEWFTRIGMSK